MEPIISFEHFGFQYTAQAEPTLYDINLTVSKGEKVLIAGPSGCGKSTLAHCMNGLIPNSYSGKSTGSLTVGGKDAKTLSLFDLSGVVGTVLQDSDGQFIGLTVAEDMAFALENDCMDQKEMKTLVEKIADVVDVTQVLSHAPSEISGGQKQRVALGGVMVSGVDVLLFDEPLANLDPATGKKAVELIDEIQKRTGCAVVIIEHRLEDVLHCPVDRIVLMGEGRILYNGDPDSLLCGELLQSGGIREPLYVTALKYAGVALTPDMQVSRLKELKLSPEQREQVVRWFHAQKRPRRKSEKSFFGRKISILPTMGGTVPSRASACALIRGRCSALWAPTARENPPSPRFCADLKHPRRAALPWTGRI